MLSHPHPLILTHTGLVGLADLWVGFYYFSLSFFLKKKKTTAWKVKVYWGQEVQ